MCKFGSTFYIPYVFMFTGVEIQHFAVVAAVTQLLEVGDDQYLTFSLMDEL